MGFFFVFSCNKDDQNTDLDSQINLRANTTKIVSADEIPQVMQFIRSKNGGSLSFTLDNSSFKKSTEPDLTLGTINTDGIIANTNAYDKTNYTFTVEKDSTDTEVSVMNYVVKET